MTDDTGCPVPCPECGSRTVMEVMGTCLVMHEGGCAIADLQDVANGK